MTAQWYYIILTVSLLLAIVLLWLEYSRPLKRWLVWRMLAVLLAVVSLTVLMLPVTISTGAATPSQEAIITTTGTSPDSIRLFSREAGKQLPQYTTHTLSQIPAGTYTRVHVFGYGLSPAELQQLPAGLQLIPHLSTPAGITHICWQQQLTQGQPFQVQGRYHNTSNKPVLLQLNGQHTLLDTITIPAQTIREFSLHTLPAHTGKTVYQLCATSNSDTLAREPVPLEVIPPAALSVLVLSAAPGFENRFVINWLADNGYKVASRTTISKNKFQYSYANQARIPLEQLTASTLSLFDVVISDVASLRNGSSAEQSALWEQVAGKGLGVVLLADSLQLPALFTGASFKLQTSGNAPQPVSLRLAGIATTVALPPAQPLYIISNPALQPLVYDAQQHLRAAAGLYGAGQLVVSTLPATYSWQLAGHPQTYSIWWTTLLQQAARPSFAGAQWQPLAFIPAIHTPVTLQLTTTDTVAAPVQVNESRVMPAQQPLLPFQWQAVYWPHQAGWQAITGTNAAITWWYAYPPQAWVQVKATEKVQATLHYAHTKSSQAPGLGTVQKNVETLPSWYAGLLLLLCCSFLWWESKTRYTDQKKR